MHANRSTPCSSRCGWVVQDFKAVNSRSRRRGSLCAKSRSSPAAAITSCSWIANLSASSRRKRAGTTLSTVADQSGHYAENLPDFLAQLLPGASRRSPFSTNPPASRPSSATNATRIRARAASSPSIAPRHSPSGSQNPTPSAIASPSCPSPIRWRPTECATARSKPSPTSNNPSPTPTRAPSSRWPPAPARPSPPAPSPTGSSNTPGRSASSSSSTAPISAARPRASSSSSSRPIRPQVHRALQRPAPHLEQARRRLPRHHLHHPAPLLHAPRRGARRRPRRKIRLRNRQPPTTARRTSPTIAAIPIETFDFIVTDECHRSIYNLWRQVLEYFDAFLIGLTATPGKQTIGFFNQNLVTEYNHERAVADGVNVGYDVYRIKTQVTEQGGTDRERLVCRPAP